MRMLVIDDDKELCEFIELALSAEDYVIESVHDGETGSYRARTNDYDLIVLDYSMPKKDGKQVCEEIRRAGKTMPIIVLSVTADVDNKVNLLNEGADDYLVKPFAVDELRARIQTLLRRPHKIESSVLQVDDLVLDNARHIVKRGKRGVYLTKKEFGLLEYLMQKQGEVCSRGMIMEHVWNHDSDPFSNTVEAHILNLRRKIGSKGKRELIINVPGRGYKIQGYERKRQKVDFN